MIQHALALRACRPAAFAGSYEPIESGEDVCAFTQGGEVLVVYRTGELLLAARAK